MSNSNVILSKLKSFKGKTIFISGASRGIGKAIALGFGKQGGNVVITGKTITKHEKLPGTIFDTADEVEKLGGKALAIEMDVRDYNSVENAVKETIRKFNTPIDVLINNASAISLTGTAATDIKKYDLMHQVNVRGSFSCAKACLPYLKESDNAHILNLSPPLDMNPIWFKNFLAYTMSKFGMSMCVLGMAEEFKSDKIAVNALWPKTGIATEAIKMITGGNEKAYDLCRKPSILSDCALIIASQDSSELTGNFFIDEDLLKSHGITDLECYSHKPGTKNFMIDFFVPGIIPPHLKDKSFSSKKSQGVTMSNPELERIYKSFEEMFKNDSFVGITKNIQFKLMHDEEKFEFLYFDMRNQAINRSLETKDADMYARLDISTFTDIMNGNTNPMTAYMKGSMKFKGSFSDAKILMQLWEKFTNQ